MDPATLAAGATALLTAFFRSKAGEKILEDVGHDSYETARKMLGWLKDRLTGHAHETMTLLELNSADQDNQDDFQVSLRKFLKSDQGAQEELGKLLEPIPQAAWSQIANVTGNQNIVNQIQGSGNSVSINATK